MFALFTITLLITPVHRTSSHFNITHILFHTILKLHVRILIDLVFDKPFGNMLYKNSNPTMKTPNILKYLLLSSCVILITQQAHACEDCGEGGSHYDPCSSCGDLECGGDCSPCDNCGSPNCPGSECMQTCTDCGNETYDCEYSDQCPLCGFSNWLCMCADICPECDSDGCSCDPCPHCGYRNCNCPTCIFCGDYGWLCFGECMEECPMCGSDGACLTTCPWWIDPDDIDPAPAPRLPHL
ncbi:hypothetical protein M2103_002549 [Ereboglobus sp. PH5-5]|nr:hypothetical protein [Ereboglobus sp. PH5-5]